jgi:hypothetical protein
MLRKKEDRIIKEIAELMSKDMCTVSLYDMEKTEILVNMFNECSLKELIVMNEARKRNTIMIEQSEFGNGNSTMLECSLSVNYVKP